MTFVVFDSVFICYKNIYDSIHLCGFAVNCVFIFSYFYWLLFLLLVVCPIFMRTDYCWNPWTNWVKKKTKWKYLRTLIFRPDVAFGERDAVVHNLIESLHRSGPNSFLLLLVPHNVKWKIICVIYKLIEFYEYRTLEKSVLIANDSHAT